MLGREIKIFMVIIVVCIISCTNTVAKKEVVSDLYQDYIKKNFDSYSNIYNDANNTITNWVIDSLKKSKPLQKESWQLDSAFVFNVDTSFLFSTINIKKESYFNSRVDVIYDMCGIQLGHSWRFFIMPNSTLISRSKYKNGLYTSYTSDELSFWLIFLDLKKV